MSCTQVNILNYNHNVVKVSGDNFLTITNNNTCTSVTIQQPVTNLVQVNAPGPQGPAGPAGPSGSQGDSVFVNIGSGSYAASGSFLITGSLTVSSSNTFTNIGPAIFSGSINVTNGITGSLQGTASYATTASYVIGGGAGSGFPFSGSAVITGSLLVSQSGLEVIGNQIMSGSIIFDGGSQITPTFYGYNNNGIDIVAGPGGFAELASNNSQSYVWVDDNGAFVVTSNQYQFEFRNDGYFVLPQVQSLTKQAGILSAGDIIIQADESQSWRFASGSGKLTAPGAIEASSFTGSLQGTSSWADNANTSSYALTASYASNIPATASYALQALSASYAANSTNANTASFAPNYLPLTGGTITGNLSITQDLVVLGTASIQNIQYVSQSSLNIGTNLITVNTSTPATRFGGLAVYDSGSTGTGRTGSILWDSQNDVWIYSNPSGAAYDGAMILVGPRNSTGIGNEVGINSWYAAIGNGSHHMTSSAIYNSGSLIRLENNTQVTGSLIVSAGITGSFSGSGANLFDIPSTAIVGLNLSQIATGSVTASVTPTQFSVISGSSTELVVTGTGVTIGNAITDTHRVTGSLNVSGSITGSLFGTASFATTSSYTPISRSFGLTINGGGSAITTGIKADVIVPYNMTISSWTLVADQSGSIVVDVWRSTYANYPPTVATSIAGSQKPTITTNTKAQNTSLTAWTSSISTGDIIRFNVDSATTITRVTLTINGIS